MKYKIPPKDIVEHLRYDAKTGLFWWTQPGLKRRLSMPAGAKRKDGYVIIKFRYQYYYAHRLAFLLVTGRYPRTQVDHKDGDPSNTRWKNLRLSTQAQNRQNARRSTRNCSGYKGVCWRADKGKWGARIKQNLKTTFLGYFDSLQAAATAYANAAKTRFGEFARV